VIVEKHRHRRPHRCAMVLTRLGENSRMVVTASQPGFDLPAHQVSGLSEARPGVGSIGVRGRWRILHPDGCRLWCAIRGFKRSCRPYCRLECRKRHGESQGSRPVRAPDREIHTPRPAAPGLRIREFESEPAGQQQFPRKANPRGPTGALVGPNVVKQGPALCGRRHGAHRPLV